MAKKSPKTSRSPVVGVVMGSPSDWDVMQHSARMLADFGVPYETLIMSAHRTPERVQAYAEEAASRGLKIIIAGAGMAAALPGMLAALTPLPVLGVPVPGKYLDGMDSLLSMAQMPGGIPVGTFAIGNAGAKNAALLAIAVLSLGDKSLAAKLIKWRKEQAAAVPANPK